mmetsp:Transcript_99034/g.137540  ORF Transcript_99034/g.137540 Transcript_99034/m.137540 type:complete len:205 (+) Transcript_99034:89-703(+)
MEGRIPDKPSGLRRVSLCDKTPCQIMGSSLSRQLPLLVVDGLLQGDRLLAVHGAADRETGPQNLLCSALELLCQALLAHLAANVQEDILRQVAAVLDVLGLLTVSEWLLESFDDQTGCIGLHVHFGLTILNGQFHSDANAFPLTCSLHNVVTHLLGRHAQRADLRRQHGGWRLFTTILTKEDHLHFIRIKLRCHGEKKCPPVQG